MSFSFRSSFKTNLNRYYMVEPRLTSSNTYETATKFVITSMGKVMKLYIVKSVSRVFSGWG